MKTHKLTLRLGIAALTVIASCLTFAACSSDDTTNSGPTAHDGGNDATVDSPANDATPDNATDSNCTSDAGNCNSCVTPQQDPLNACAPGTANCISFDKGRVPSHPQL
jgi:hypothetical protein